MPPLVSIIIPVYKAEEDLPKCIKSCLNQTYENIEIILVNDGSPDNCINICHEYAAKDSRIKVIDKTNTGVSDTRNIGMQKASGDFIMFVDADDWVEPQMLQEMINYQSTHNFDLTIAGMTLYRDDKVHTIISPQIGEFIGNDAISSHLAKACNIIYYRPPVVKLFKHSLLTENHITFDTDLKVNEDFLFVLEYLKICRSVGTYNCSFYNYNQTFSSEKSRHYDYADVYKQWELNLQQFHAYKNFFVSSHSYEKNAAAVNAYLISRIRGFLTSVLLAGGDKQTIKTILNEIENMPEYKDLLKLRINDTPDKIEKFILFCCKHRAWRLLYFGFNCKNTLYNKRVYKN